MKAESTYTYIHSAASCCRAHVKCAGGSIESCAEVRQYPNFHSQGQFSCQGGVTLIAGWLAPVGGGCRGGRQGVAAAAAAVTMRPHCLRAEEGVKESGCQSTQQQANLKVVCYFCCCLLLPAAARQISL